MSSNETDGPETITTSSTSIPENPSPRKARKAYWKNQYKRDVREKVFHARSLCLVCGQPVEWMRCHRECWQWEERHRPRAPGTIGIDYPNQHVAQPELVGR